MTTDLNRDAMTPGEISFIEGMKLYRFYTTRQIAQILHKNVATIRRYIHQNKFMGTVFFGKEYLIPEASLIKFLHKHSPQKFAERSI